jgi:Ca2+-binding RTX toxin-like protein
MAKTLKRWLGLEDTAMARIDQPTVLPAQVDGPGDKYVPLPKPKLFTPYDDVVDFNDLKPGQYDPASFYSALRGSDLVDLPADQATANALGYDATKIFHGEYGDDTITGGALNDFVMGDQGNDFLYGKSGNDGLDGGTGNDQLYGDTGNDVIVLGAGIDYVVAGAGNDIISASNIDESLLAPGASAPAPVWGGKIYRDYIIAGDGNDTIFASNSDHIDGGTGNDAIHLIADDITDSGGTVGGNGSDTIVGSTANEWIYTGQGWLSWSINDWTAASKAAFGGANDVVNSGDGDDTVLTMMYCNATVDTGKGHDNVFVHGMMDLISTGDGSDELYLDGGATKADLGAGNDYLMLTRAAYDNPNHSEITLGAGQDHIQVNTDEWATNGDKQSMNAAPVILDFNLAQDVIDHIWATNLDDASQSLNADYFKCIQLSTGAALVYDDPFVNSHDFVVAKFNGISAQDLQTHIDLNTQFL